MLENFGVVKGYSLGRIGRATAEKKQSRKKEMEMIPKIILLLLFILVGGFLAWLKIKGLRRLVRKLMGLIIGESNMTPDDFSYVPLKAKVWGLLIIILIILVCVIIVFW